MSDQILITTCVVLCSLGGWYLIVSKYLALKAKLRDNLSAESVIEAHATIVAAKNVGFNKSPVPTAQHFIPTGDFDTDQHIPGMGPPPLSNLPFNIPPDVLAKLKHSLQSSVEPGTSNSTAAIADQAPNRNVASAAYKRNICNWASIVHLSGLALVTGIPFLNIIFPTVLWLLKKEQHPYLARQGRDVINFQITVTIVQFLCLGLGTVFIWITPNAAAALIAWTKTLRVVFATGMYTPCNLFTVVPFFWGCILALRGAVAAYNGLSFKYPLAQTFIFAGTTPLAANQHSQRVVERKEPQLQPEQPTIKPPSKSSKISFG